MQRRILIVEDEDLTRQQLKQLSARIPLGRIRADFGMSGTYAAMWSIDKRRKIVPDYDFVSFPARAARR